MVEIVKLATPFPATALVDLILKNELFDLNASRTFSLLGDKIFLDSYSSNLKLFDFKVSLEDSNEMTIRLRILHGSVFTYIWNTFSRVDEEFLLEYTSRSSSMIFQPLWSVRGMDPWNSKIVSADINWCHLKQLQHQMLITEVGVQAFSKLLGRIVLSLPYYFKERSFLAPMPPVFMFNYMMAVTSSPCENLIDMSLVAQIPSINSFVLPNGEGAQIFGYHLRLKGGSLVLHHSGTGDFSYSTSYHNLTKDHIIRVVELRQHPLGTEIEILVLLEIVDRNMENGSIRCVCLEANKIINAICTSPINEEYIEVLDAKDWDRISSQWVESILTFTNGDKSERERYEKMNKIDFENSCLWGSENYKIGV